MKTTRARLGSVCLLLAAPLAACDLDSGWPFDRSCASRPATGTLDGTWTVGGQGKRKGCEDARLNTEALTLEIGPLRIAQTGAQLALAEPLALPPGVSFAFDEAWVSGACVSFTATEQRADGDEVRLTFEGERSGHRVTGRFQGFGPGTCRLEGDFHVDVRR